MPTRLHPHFGDAHNSWQETLSGRPNTNDARTGPQGVNWLPRFLFDNFSLFPSPWFLRVLSLLPAERMRWIGNVLWVAVAFAPSQVGNGATSAGSSQGGAGTAVRAGTFIIHLEQKKDDKAVAMYPGHVFQPGDVVRFRVTARGMEGYLYVIDQGSSGAYTTLYPAQGSHAETFLHVDQDVFVPSVEDGWFEVGGPAGIRAFCILWSAPSRSILARARRKVERPGRRPHCPTR